MKKVQTRKYQPRYEQLRRQ